MVSAARKGEVLYRAATLSISPLVERLDWVVIEAAHQ